MNAWRNAPSSGRDPESPDRDPCRVHPWDYRLFMATHDVTIDLPTRFVLHSDVTFVVWSDDVKLGELQVSKGSIDWLPGNGRTRYRTRWEKFNELMKEGGRRMSR